MQTRFFVCLKAWVFIISCSYFCPQYSILGASLKSYLNCTSYLLPLSKILEVLLSKYCSLENILHF